MRHTQAPLPYDKDALAPLISEATMTCHYDKHHAGYVRKLNKLTTDVAYADLDLVETIQKARIAGDIDILRNAAQSWNHDFFWQGLSPKGGNPDGSVKEAIESSFNSYDEFKKAFVDTATSLFGSGWVWLVVKRGELRIVSSENAESPVGTDLVPLLTLDVWEHAYYLDYQNERKRFAEVFLDKLVNWNFVAANLEAANQQKAA